MLNRCSDSRCHCVIPDVDRKVSLLHSRVGWGFFVDIPLKIKEVPVSSYFSKSLYGWILNFLK